jgi:catechol 2,3-dioxygenase-like lactoylglutathione lyase family enzyme
VGSAATPSDRPPRRGLGVSGISHISLVVDDLERSRPFYEGFLGLQPLPTPEGAGRAAHYRCGQTEIHLLPAEEHPRPSRRHVAFLVDDFDRVLHALDSQRVRIAGGPMRREHDGSRYVFFQDPDGNLIEVTESPGER